MPNILTPFSKPSLVFGTWSTGYSWIPDYRQERNYAAAMLDAVTKSGVKHAVAFNYRFVPAVRQAKYLIEQGALGTIYHFRAKYCQEWIMDPQFPRVWRLQKSVEIGRAHV